MNAKTFLILALLVLPGFSGAQKAYVEERIVACATVGTTKSGSVMGIRLYEENGEFTAKINIVNMWHHQIIAYEPQPVAEFIIEKVEDERAITYYYASDFSLFLDSPAPVITA